MLNTGHDAHHAEIVSEQNARLSKLEECCTMLAQSTKNLETQMIHMHENVNQNFLGITEAISHLTTYDMRKNKMPKSIQNPAMEMDLY